VTGGTTRAADSAGALRCFETVNRGTDVWADTRLGCQSGKDRLPDRHRLVHCLFGFFTRVSDLRKPHHPGARRLHPGDSRGWHGDRGDRAGRRFDDRRDLRDVRRLDAPSRRPRRFDTGRDVAGISPGADGGRHQWRADCLCRDPGAVRHARHGATGLWLRSLRSRSALRRLYAPQRQRHRVDRWRLHCGHADADSVFRVDSAAWFFVPALLQAGAVHLCDRR
jgi:hypothetical protein